MTWQDILKEKKVISLEDFIEKEISSIKRGYAEADSNFYTDTGGFRKPIDKPYVVDLKDNHGNLQIRAYDKLEEMGIKTDGYVVDIPSSRYIVTIRKGTLGGNKRYSDYFDDEQYDSKDPNRLVE
tara:strand:+ start:772 stop:1146 length:375 start_codon:yes stop_codon:yes gene_type:complete